MYVILDKAKDEYALYDSDCERNPTTLDYSYTYT